LLCLPVLLLHFAIFYSVSALIAVCTRSTAACVFGSVLFWLLCWGMNYGRHAAMAAPEVESASPALMALVEAGYWLLPKPADFGILLFDALGAGDCFGQLPEFQAAQDRGAFRPELAVPSSLAFAVVTLALAGWQFALTDY
ncbi:MAG TPA: hypothetical protein VFA26_11195, partial [Gemmataceae bacterium]|nr:hypothetical protein [Gemmataceae bacterium]